MTLASSPGTAVGGASANITLPNSASDFANGYPQMPLFTDGTGTLYTGSVDTSAQITGFAQRIAVNGNLANNSSYLTASGPNDLTASGGGRNRCSRADHDAADLLFREWYRRCDGALYRLRRPVHAGHHLGPGQRRQRGASTLNNTQQVSLSTAQSRFSQSAG